jgi:DNA-binding CsgD family transcriptional regulator/predicted DNA-binding protein (UPF0251 family)
MAVDRSEAVSSGRRAVTDTKRGFKKPMPLLTEVPTKQEAQRTEPAPGPLVTKIKEILRRKITGKRKTDPKLSKAAALEQIISRAGLTDRERGVLELYILPDSDRLTLRQTAEKLGIAVVTVSLAVRRIRCRLQGKSIYGEKIEGYRRLDDQEISTLVRRSGAKSRSDLHKKDYPLCVVANERGISDIIFPPQKNREERMMDELKALWDVLCRKRASEELMQALTPFERDIIRKTIDTKRPLPLGEFADSREVNLMDVSIAMRRLIRKLNGEEVTGDVLDQLKILISAMSARKRKRLRSQLGKKELAVLERRVLPSNPGQQKPFRAMGASFGVSAEAIRIVEETMYLRIHRWEGGKEFRRREGRGKRILRINRMIERLRSKGMAKQNILKKAGFNSTEKFVYRRCVLSEMRFNSAANKLGVSNSTISDSIGRIELKLLLLERRMIFS